MNIKRLRQRLPVQSSILAKSNRVSQFLLFFLVLLVFAGNALASFYVIAGGARARQTIFISPKQSYEASGQGLLDALRSIQDNGPDKPYLIKIEPGVYDIGSESLQMKPWVDVEGSGKDLTTIWGRVDSPSQGVVTGAGNAAIRMCTIWNNGGSGHQRAFGIHNQSSFVMSGVAVIAKSAEMVAGVVNYADSGSIQPIIERSTINVFGTDKDVHGISNQGNIALDVKDTKIIVGGNDSDGNVACGIYAWGNDKLKVYRTSISVDGGHENYGILSLYHGFDIVDSNIEINDPGRYHYGVSFAGPGSQIEMRTSRIESVGDGIYCIGGDTVNSDLKVMHSTIIGAYKAIETQDALTVSLGSVQLQGGFKQTGVSPTYQCHRCFDQQMNPVSCP